MKTLLIINPNSDAAVTAAISQAVSPWRALGVQIDCRTNAAGPKTISSNEDVARCGDDVAEMVSGAEADAILVACFSDPGVERLRATQARPVLGIQEAGILAALSRAPKFGVIALSERAVPRHLARIDALGLSGRLVGEIGLSGYGALEVGQSDRAFAEALEACETLRSQGAGAVVLGCAGFGPRRAALAAQSGLVIIDPVLAGVTLATGTLLGG